MKLKSEGKMILQVGIVFFIFAVGSIHSSQSTYLEDKVREQIFRGYNKHSLPERNIPVSLRISLLHFNMNEQLQSLDLDIWMSLRWKDFRLSWDEKLRQVTVDPDLIWTPDITLYNSARAENIDLFSKTKAVIVNDGSILWVPPAHINAACTMDMTYWPHDIHNCTAKFGSWVHSLDDIDFIPEDDQINMEMVGGSLEESNLTRAEWEILDTTVIRNVKKYDCCPEAYVSIRATFIVKRMSEAYIWTIKIPLIILGLMTIAVFLLPPTAGEKVILGSIVLVVNLIFLFSVSSLIGHPSSHTPLIVRLISKQIVLSGVSVLISGLVLRLVRDPHSSGLPSCVKIPIICLSSCLCLGGYRQMVATAMVPITRSMKGEDLELNESGGTRGLFTPESSGGGENDWLLFAAVIDRICLVIFSSIFLINMITYSSVL